MTSLPHLRLRGTLRGQYTRRAPRALAVLGVALAVLLLHAALLGGLPRAPGAGPAVAATGPVLQVRQLRRPAPPEAGLPMPAAAVARPVPSAVPALPAPRTGRSPAAEAAARPELPAAAATMDRATTPPADADAPLALAGGTALPVYATRLPPAATLQYTLQREGAGAVAATGRAPLQAELRWRPGADAYTLTLGFGATGWASVGARDLHGLAPARHVETRRGRELRAANFRREAGPGGGRITFSGPPVEHSLLPGAQDRLSWMLQLAAVLEADPALGQPGREVQLFVAGVRGDAAVWTFTVLAREAADLPAGTVADAVHLHREPARPYDTRVDVWLDPARHHLPVRVRLQNRVGGVGEGESTDFALSQLSLP